MSAIHQVSTQNEKNIEKALPREAYSLDEFSAMFGISKSTTYAMIRKGVLKPGKMLGRTVITHAEKERIAASLQEDA